MRRDEEKGNTLRSNYKLVMLIDTNMIMLSLTSEEATYGGFLLYRGLCTAHLYAARPHPGAPSGNSPMPGLGPPCGLCAHLLYAALSLFMSHLLITFPSPLYSLSPCLMHKPHSITFVQQLSSQKQTRPPFCTLVMCSHPLYLSHLFFLSDDLSHPAYTYSYIALETSSTIACM